VGYEKFINGNEMKLYFKILYLFLLKWVAKIYRKWLIINVKIGGEK
jgi:hypothetical protein